MLQDAGRLADGDESSGAVHVEPTDASFRDVRVWDRASGKQMADFPEIVGTTSVAFSPNGRLLAYARLGGIVRVVDLTTNNAITLRTSDVARIAFSPDGQMLATATERSATSRGQRAWTFSNRRKRR